jgi:hypothetical protein
VKLHPSLKATTEAVGDAATVETWRWRIAQCRQDPTTIAERATMPWTREYEVVLGSDLARVHRRVRSHHPRKRRAVKEARPQRNTNEKEVHLQAATRMARATTSGGGEVYLTNTATAVKKGDKKMKTDTSLAHAGMIIDTRAAGEMVTAIDQVEIGTDAAMGDWAAAGSEAAEGMMITTRRSNSRDEV